MNRAPKWTEEEMSNLKSIVEQEKSKGDKLNWDDIAAKVGKRFGSMCFNKWTQMSEK